MSYISKIREKIGHELLIYLGAGVIVYSDEKILLQKRKDNGTWALHAGGIEDRFITYPNMDQVYMPGLYYICRDFTGSLRPQMSEVEELKWFKFKEIPKNIHEPNRRVIEDFIQLIAKE